MKPRILISSVLMISIGPNCTAIALENASQLVTRAAALKPDSERGRQLYEHNCSSCHRAEGSATGARQYPQLGGQQQEYLLQQLAQFVALGRLAPKMHEVLQQASVNDAQSLRDMSFFLAIQRQEVHGEHGDGRNLARGRSLYTLACSKCHGEFGQGSEQGPIPAVGGQNYTYLREQVNSFIGGHRSMVDPALMNTVYRLSQDDVRAVADYMSRMPASVDVHYGVIGATAPAAGADGSEQKKKMQ